MIFTAAKIKRYLLGDFALREKEEFEWDFFKRNQNDFLWLKILISEDELIEGYLDQTLLPAEAELFIGNFLVSSRRRERFAFLGLLKTTLSATAARDS